MFVYFEDESYLANESTWFFKFLAIPYSPLPQIWAATSAWYPEDSNQKSHNHNLFLKKNILLAALHKFKAVISPTAFETWHTLTYHTVLMWYVQSRTRLGETQSLLWGKRRQWDRTAMFPVVQEPPSGLGRTPRRSHAGRHDVNIGSSLKLRWIPQPKFRTEDAFRHWGN